MQLPKPELICAPTNFSRTLLRHGKRVMGRLFSCAFLSSFLYTGAQCPHFHLLGHAFLKIQELNKVVRGADNSLAPIFKAFEGMTYKCKMKYNRRLTDVLGKT